MSDSGQMMYTNQSLPFWDFMLQIHSGTSALVTVWDSQCRPFTINVTCFILMKCRVICCLVNPATPQDLGWGQTWDFTHLKCFSLRTCFQTDSLDEWMYQVSGGGTGQNFHVKQKNQHDHFNTYFKMKGWTDDILLFLLKIHIHNIKNSFMSQINLSTQERIVNYFLLEVD